MLRLGGVTSQETASRETHKKQHENKGKEDARETALGEGQRGRTGTQRIRSVRTRKNEREGSAHLSMKGPKPWELVKEGE